MRCNAISRPPPSQTAALILMLSSCALARAPRMIRLASSSVRLIDLSSPEGLVLTYIEPSRIRKAAIPRGFRILDYGAGDPRVLNAIHGRPGGSIGICFIEWSGEEEQRVVVDWAAVRDEEDAGVVAASILAAPRSFMGRTSISSGIDFAVVQFATSKWQVERRGRSSGASSTFPGGGTNNSGRSVT